jgi:hypothetical protein
VIAQQPSDTVHQATGGLSQDTDGDAAGAYQGVSGNGDRADRIVDGGNLGDQDKVNRVRLGLGIRTEQNDLRRAAAGVLHAMLSPALAPLFVACNTPHQTAISRAMSIACHDCTQ